MTTLRVGYDVTPLAGRRTGVGNYTHAVLNHMLMRGEGFEFRCLSTGRNDVDLRSMVAEHDPATLALHRHVPVPTRAMYKLWSWTGYPRADQLVGGADVYHATNYYLPPVKSARTVLSIYDLAFLKHPAWCSPKIVGPFSSAVRRFSGKADAIVACSEATRQDVVSMLGVPQDRVHVVHGAVADDFARTSRPAAVDLLAHHYNLKLPFALFVSTLEPRKNVEGMLRAFAQIARDVPHKLILVGGLGWGMRGFQSLVESLGLSGRVQMMGFVERAHLPAFYAAADLFFFPSLYEGFGLPVLEAMTCGCPVITSNSSSLPEVGGDAAQYVDPADVDHMAATLRMVLESEPLRESMSRKGLAQAARFSWDASADATLNVYRSLT